MQSPSGHSNMPAIVGVALFTQFWYWFPASHFLSLAFTPTAIIGVNADLNMPELEFTSNARPSLFAYIPPTKPPQTAVVEKVATAVLSTTAKAQAKARKAKGAEGEAMEVEEEKPEKVRDVTNARSVCFTLFLRQSPFLSNAHAHVTTFSPLTDRGSQGRRSKGSKQSQEGARV